MALAKGVALFAILAAARASGSEGPVAADGVAGVASALRGAVPALTAQAEAGGCGMLGGMAPKCMRDCPEMCEPLRAGEHEFLHGKGRRDERRAAALAELCKNKASFMCGQKNKKHCDPMVGKAKMLGFSMPRTEAEFDQQCHR